MKKVVLLLLVVFFLTFSVACSKESEVFFSTSQNRIPLQALNDNALSGVIRDPQKSSYAYFSFNKEDLPVFTSALKTTPVSCQITVVPFPGETIQEGNFAFGFLYDTDFESSGKLKKDLEDRNLIQGTVSTDMTPFSLAYYIPAEDAERISGFFVFSTIPLQIRDPHLGEVKLGYTTREALPTFYFGSHGGFFDIKNPVLNFDYSSGTELFGSDYATVWPVYTVELSECTSMPEKFKDQERVFLSIGEEEIFIRRAPHQRSVSLHWAGLKNPGGAVEFGTNASMIEGLVLTNEKKFLTKNMEPLNTDPGMLPLWTTTHWRQTDFELFEWEEFPGVLYFDTKDYDVQSDFFTRLAFFTEKAGYIGTLVPDHILAGMHGYNAHDYRAESLADFFTLAEKTDFPLNEKEHLLKEILLHNGIILPSDSGVGYKPGQGAVISISQESPLYLRYTFIAHEGFHGIYFSDETFRNAVAEVYNTADKKSIQFLQNYFVSQPTLNYNIDDTYLMQNEFMAYIMQQSVANTGPYFADNLAHRNSMKYYFPEDAAYVQQTKGTGFTEASLRLSTYTFNRWGIEAGRVSLVGR